MKETVANDIEASQAVKQWKKMEEVFAERR